MKKILTTVVLLICSTFGTLAAAGPIGPGFDLYATRSASIDLSSLGLGLGVVDLVGLPLDSGSSNNTDTVMGRTGALSAGETGTIDIEILSLSLTAADPVQIPVPPPPPIPPVFSIFDVFVDLSLPANGKLDIIEHDDPNGGDFNLDEPIIYALRVTFRAVDDPAFEFVEEIIDTVDFGDVPWSHTAAESYPTIPSHGGFYPAVEPATGARVPFTIKGSVFRQTLAPASIPEPGSLLLLLLGFAVAQVVKTKKGYGIGDRAKMGS